MRSSPAGRTPVLLLPLLAIAFAFSASPAYSFETIRCLLADGFDYPVGKPEAKGYHKARGMSPNGHLGEDWDGDGGGDTDLGDPIYCTARGVVLISDDFKMGWGNVIIIRHAFRETNGRIDMVDSLYGHLLERKMKVGQVVQKGDLVGTMGTNNGMYPAHLHFEMRKNLAIGMNRMKFARDYSNYYSPTAFIQAHRVLVSDSRKYDIPINTFAPHGEDLNAEQRAFAATLTAKPSSSGGSEPPPTIVETESGSRKGRSSEPSSGSNSGVRNTGHGLSIPLNTTGEGGGKTSNTGPSSGGGKLPKVTPKPDAPPPSPTTEDTPKSDFWSRLKTKLGNGQSVDSSGR